MLVPRTDAERLEAKGKASEFESDMTEYVESIGANFGRVRIIMTDLHSAASVATVRTRWPRWTRREIASQAL